MDKRLNKLHNWSKQVLDNAAITLQAISNDASSRRYFRIQHHHSALIAVDAPPQHEKNELFILIANTLRQHGLNTPKIVAQQMDLGFLLISDFGDQHYLHAVLQGANSVNVDQLYQQALTALIRIAQCQHFPNGSIPIYDRDFIMNELVVFKEWFLHKQLGLTLDQKSTSMLTSVFEHLTENALAQPTVAMHRDFHSRNLMVLPENNPGILDFQDMVYGPLTYDAVSLLRDCYIQWDSKQVIQWALDYYELARSVNLLAKNVQQSQYLCWFDLMGLQRHLKVLGTFARLNLRDNKPGYLADMPRIVDYILMVSANYPALKAFHHFVETVISPRIEDITSL